MLKSVPRIGAFVLDTLTTGMYNDPLDAIRELIQNASDAIRRARQTGLLKSDQGQIILVVDPGSRSLRIRDDGTGISQADVEGRLLNIGMSEKEVGLDSGFRGIGRLAGIAYCKALVFRTRSTEEDPVVAVKLDCEGLRRAILPDHRQEGDLVDVLAQHTQVYQDTKPSDSEHFFEVVLEGITQAASMFLDQRRLELYLQQVAPVGFDAQRFIFAPQIKAWLEQRGIESFSVDIKIESPNGPRIVYKPYKGFYSTRGNEKYKVEAKGIHFLPHDASSASPYYIWFAETDCPGMIDDEAAAGLRIRVKNIGIGGPERVDELFGENTQSDMRFNYYFFGEVHIQDTSVIPNARRDGLELIGGWPSIRESLVAFARERKQEIRRKSETRNQTTQKVTRKIEKTLNDVESTVGRGIASKEERDQLLGRLDRESARVDEALQGKKSESDTDTLAALKQKVEAAKGKVKDKNSFAAQRLRPNLDRKQRKTIQEILEILRHQLEESQFTRAQDAILERFGMVEEEAVK